MFGRISRRGLLKAAAGLVAFLPVVWELVRSSEVDAQDCGCGGPIAGPPPPGYQRCDVTYHIIIWMCETGGLLYQNNYYYDVFSGSLCYAPRYWWGYC